MANRHVWILPPLGVGEKRPGLVLTWRRRIINASPPTWEAYVCWVDVGRDDVRFEWVPAMYLEPVTVTQPQ